MALVNASRTYLEAVLKQLFSARGIESAVYTKFPILGALKKDASLEGLNAKCPILFSNGTPGSATANSAKLNASYPRYVPFLIDAFQDYALQGLDNKLIASMRSNKGSFVTKVTQVAQAALNVVGADLAIQCFGNAGGRAQVASVSAGTGYSGADVVTITPTSAIHRFEIGQVLVATSGAASGELTALRAGTMTVLRINRAAGTFECVAVGGLGANDWLIRQGDDYATGSSHKVMRGLEAWIPTTAPVGAESFFGVDRSIDSRLVGLYNSSTYTVIEEALIDAVSQASEMGGEPDVCFVNPVKFRALIKQLGSKTNYDKFSAKANSKDVDVGYRSVVIEGDAGPVRVISDRFCLSTFGYVLSSDMWTLYSMGELVHWAESADGNKWHSQWLESTAVDGQFIVACSYPALGCGFPGANSKVLLP